NHRRARRRRALRRGADPLDRGVAVSRARAGSVRQGARADDRDARPRARAGAGCGSDARPERRSRVAPRRGRAAMRAYLRVFGTVLLIGGTLVCIMCIVRTLGDEHFYRAAMALERHEDNVLYLFEYQAALLPHAAYIGLAVVSGLLAAVGSAI